MQKKIEKNQRLILVVNGHIVFTRPVFGIVTAVLCLNGEAIMDYYYIIIALVEQIMVCKVIRI